jgi:hypothetical protein
MAYKIATFKDENGNLFVEHECESSEDKIVLIRAFDANKAQKLLDKVNEFLKDFWRRNFENGLYNCDWFGLGLAPLDDNGNYVSVNGKNCCNVTLILPEEWSDNAVERTARRMIEALSEKFEMTIEDIDHDYVFLSVDFTDISLAFGCGETFTE